MALDYVTPSDMSKHEVLRRREFIEPNWNLPQAREWGFIRGLSKGLQASSANIGWVNLPFGQGTPVHSSSAEHIIVNLEGQVEFRFLEGSVELEPFDSLYIPANYQYSYFNVGAETVRFFTIICRYDDFPAVGNYSYESVAEIRS